MNGDIHQYWHFGMSLSGLHFDGGNLLFLDGHVKWRKLDSLRAKEFGLADFNTTTPSKDTIAVDPATGYSRLF